MYIIIHFIDFATVSMIFILEQCFFFQFIIQGRLSQLVHHRLVIQIIKYVFVLCIYSAYNNSTYKFVFKSFKLYCRCQITTMYLFLLFYFVLVALNFFLILQLLYMCAIIFLSNPKKCYILYVYVKNFIFSNKEKNLLLFVNGVKKFLIKQISI